MVCRDEGIAIAYLRDEGEQVNRNCIQSPWQFNELPGALYALNEKSQRSIPLGFLWWAHWIRTSVLACQLDQSKTVSTADQLPTESELSGCQGGNPDFMRGPGGSHKLSADLKNSIQR